MLNKIISFSVKNKLIIGLFVIALVGWGTYEVTRLPIDAVPDITDNQVQVITVSPALGAPDVERLITFPIEQSCSNIPGLKQLRSFSRFGLSLVTVVFNDETDIYWARQQIAERLAQVQDAIPNGIGKPEMAPVTTGLGEIYQYVVRPKKGYEGKYTAMDLRTLQDWTVRRLLLGTPGVADVSSFGGVLKQYEIAVRPEQLKAYGITIAEVFDALEKNNQNTGGAYIEKGPTVLYIRSEGLTGSLADIEKIVVKNLNNGVPLLIRDVAEVHLGAATRYGAMCFNQDGEVAGAVVMMLKGENSSAVIKRVKAKVAEIQKALPEGVVIEPFLDRTKMVNNAIQTVEQNLMEGALIVVFVLVFFLGNFRAGLIVSSVIPLSMLFAIILMNKFGVGGNLMSLGAIDFGLIVDGTVIVVEAILHRFSHSKHFRNTGLITQEQMDKEVNTSTGLMIRSAVFSQIIILIVYFPILSLQGIEGKMFKPMALTVAFAILGAFLLSITYVPMMSALCLNKKISHKLSLADKMMMRLERLYQPVLSRVMNFPRTIIAGICVLMILAVIVLGQMGGEFIPQLEEGDFAVETRLLTGSNLKTTIKATQQASGILLKQFPEVQKVVTKIGSAEIPTDPMPLEAADMMVILKPKKEWTSAKSFPELSQKMTEALSVVPGISVGFQFPVQMRFNELMTGARQDVVCKIFGEDLDSLAFYANKLGDVIRTVKGAVNLYVESVTGMPQIVINYNRDAMARYGLNVSDINRVVNTAFAGQSAGVVYEGEKRFDMVVRLAGEARQNISDVENLLVPAANGIQIPLYQVAEIKEIEGPNQIQRENTRRRIIVGFNVNGRDVQTIVQELQQKVAAQVKLPLGYSIVYGGAFDNLTGAKQRLSIVVPIALLLIFLLLYFAFSSIKQGLLIYSAIPLSAIGGIFAMGLRGMPFSISAGVGFIALFGVAVLNGILLVNEFNRLKKDGWHDVRRIVIHATKSKLRAVLMTALVPSLGFIPMAISTGAGAEVQKPLATVVIGGLIVSTMLTLFVLPVLYILFEKGFRFYKKGAAVAILLLLGAGLHAQDKINLQQSLDMAVKNNLRIKAAKSGEDYYAMLRKSSFNPDKMQIGAEYGHINSKANDNRFTISQGIEFPTVYKRQRDLGTAYWQISQAHTRNAENELKARVKSTFYLLLALQEKKRLLVEADSIYAAFVTKATLRLKTGDTDALEKATAENQRLQIAAQLTMLNTDYAAALQLFGILLNSNTPLAPVADSLVYHPATLPENSGNAPLLQLQQKQLEATSAAYKLEKSKMLPSLNIGYANGSIIGYQNIGSGEQFYGSGTRFSAVSAGVGIPLFGGAQRARIRAGNILIQQQQQELAASKQQLDQELSRALNNYTRYQELLQTYKTVQLPNAGILIEGANKRLNSGETSYLEWTILINQAIETRSNYYNLIIALNDVAFDIEKISGIN
ncbi:CusA/CzcA family heavy metal efflux RND transporter [Chitinophaga sancti]|uniref:Cobalt-zinc-cadmium resistance protein CzcA n=1 Tax=Chitinophaga sancti TaxID=1004 RepID=A0A1K1NA28_9BACT|nr:CusA/CzcA family heavy metal efflux RND transporter [Chitinophaga sancti]WQD63421.1 CusA/CzcA family heavy metal efflux RND transporter [Chitinophaga sancti]WQG90953.1 CusA/CzcA family heavy metal efflux RND transporter [Chitinophaga sancti]SFW32258.1 cobalt-zinc-cadmium resistance protein CzcA [Chitinophaga sancti]